jgi:hypothetical protein
MQLQWADTAVPIRSLEDFLAGPPTVGGALVPAASPLSGYAGALAAVGAGWPDPRTLTKEVLESCGVKVFHCARILKVKRD